LEALPIKDMFKDKGAKSNVTLDLYNWCYAARMAWSSE
jgi:hypothetical protein